MEGRDLQRNKLCETLHLQHHFFLTVPSAPEDVHVIAVSPMALNLSWQPPSFTNGVIQRYIINITEVNTGNSFLLETTQDFRFVVVNNLHPYYQYRCIVAAETVGLGPFSTAVIIELPEDGKTTQNTTQHTCAWF